MTDPTTPPTVEEFTLVLRSTPSDLPTEVRMRHVLKTLLRRYQFRLADYYVTNVPVRPAAKTGGGGSGR